MTYLCIRKAGDKYVVHPTTEAAMKLSVDSTEAEVWLYASEKDVAVFAQANVFCTYDSQASAESAIVMVDPGVDKVYRPPNPPSA